MVFGIYFEASYKLHNIVHSDKKSFTTERNPMMFFSIVDF